MLQVEVHVVQRGVAIWSGAVGAVHAVVPVILLLQRRLLLLLRLMLLLLLWLMRRRVGTPIWVLLWRVRLPSPPPLAPPPPTLAGLLMTTRRRPFPRLPGRQ